MKKPNVHSSKILCQGFYSIRQDKLEKIDGGLHTYSSVILHTDAVAVLCQTRDQKWVLNREYRHPTGLFLLGCPGGRLEPGEDPIAGGQRELFEETGYWTDEIQIIGCSHPFPGMCNQKIYYLLARNAEKKGEQKLDAFELIEVEIKTDEELKEEIQKNTAIDSILCTALWYKSQLG